LSGCGDDGAIFDEENNYCYYIDSTCAAQGRTPSSVTCGTLNAGVTRVCPCGTYVPQTDDTNVPSGTETTDGEVSSATRPLISLFLAVPFFFMGGNSRVALFAFLAAALPMTFAHNWVNSLSRSPSASTYQPCKPPLTDLPHAQVGPGQYFQVEWMTGHGDYAYFTTIHSRNADKMKLHTPTLLNDYINKAPNGSNTAMQRRFQKYHRKETPTLDNDVTDNFVANMFAEIVYPNSTDYIYRPPVFEGVVRRYQMRYNPQFLSEDIRVSYQSTLYPWIEAVYKFKVNSWAGGRVDTTNFIIPGYGGSGRYIVQYYWRGYRDCTDVDYKTTQVADIYGLPFNGTRWTKIDHCLFENVRNVYTSFQVFNDPQDCLARCTFTDCYGVNVVPLVAPDSAYKGFRPGPRDIWMYPNFYGSDIYVPWNQTAFNTSRYLYMSNPNSQKYLCYTVNPAEFTDTTDEYTLASDPEDPIFYSTCYYRFRGNLFADYATKVSPDSIVPWRYFDKCIGCDTQTSNTDPRMISKWTLEDKCVNCDYEPKPAKPVLYYPVEAGVKCDGQNPNAWSRPIHSSCPNTTQCWKQLRVIGRPNMVVSAAECKILASEDSDCSNTYMHRNTTNNCYCYSNRACCKTCSRVPDTTYNTYHLSTTADPTCATGTLSTDNTACCSKECGAGNCNTVAAAQDPVGFCYATSITRPCAQYGPPCKM
jgi:hypothetical protein